MIGSAAPEQLKQELQSFLRDNTDVFSWTHEDMPDIDLQIIAHYLNISSEARPVKQKRRSFTLERNEAVAAR